MSMKKACNCLLLALLVQLVAGCGNLNQAEPSNGCSDSTIKTLTITTGASVARSITAERLDCSSLTYYFAITNLINNSKSLQTYTSPTDEVFLDFPIELESGYYRIGIYALDAEGIAKISGDYPTDFNDGDLEAACVLSGRATVDLRQDETVDVALTTNRLVQTGNVALNFYTNGWTLDTAKFSAVCGIKNKAGALIGNEVNLWGVTNVPPDPSALPLYSATLQQGTYTFYVNYTKNDSSAVYTWTDSIFVTSNRTIRKTVALSDIIDHAPAAPSAFKAAYQDFDSSSDWCYVNFAWDDNANNERGFEIELLAVSAGQSDGDITSDMAGCWDSLTPDGSKVTGSFTQNGGAYIKSFDQSGYGVDGSLLKNSQSATFKLSRGYRYLARIRSVGTFKADPSDWVYVDFTLGGTGKNGYYAFDPAARYMKVGD